LNKTDFIGSELERRR